MPIVQTEATEGKGVDELVAKLLEHRAHIEAAGTLVRAPPAQPAQRGPRARHSRLRRRLEARMDADPAFEGDRRRRRARIDPASAAKTILEDEPG